MYIKSLSISPCLQKSFLLIKMKRSNRFQNIMEKVDNSTIQRKTTRKDGKDINNLLTSMLGQPSESESDKSDLNVENVKNDSSSSIRFPMTAKLVAKKLLSAKNADNTIKTVEGDVDSPNSGKSISPPPYSPLTPLLLRSEPNIQNDFMTEKNVDSSSTFQISATPTQYSPLTHLLLQNESTKINESISMSEPLSSPLPPMTPETQKLLETLTNTSDPINIMMELSEDIVNIDNNSSGDENENQQNIKNVNIYDEDDDDSIKDPDYVDISEQNEDETDSQFESDDDNSFLKANCCKTKTQPVALISNTVLTENNMQPSDSCSSNLLKYSSSIRNRKSESEMTEHYSKGVCGSSSTFRSLLHLKKFINFPVNDDIVLAANSSPAKFNKSASLLKRTLSENDLTNQPSNRLYKSVSLSNTPTSKYLKINDNINKEGVLSCNARVEFEMLPQKPIKRRVSETNLIKLSSKRSYRSSSSSGDLFSLQKPENNPNLCPKEPKKKHIADPSKWKRNIQRNKRIKGEAYKTVKGKPVPARPTKQPKCVTMATHKCNEAVPEPQRLNIYTAFRSLKTLEKQREFIVRHISKEPKKRTTVSGPSRKKYTHRYTLTIDNNKTVIVCRDFFLSTLNITEGMVRGALHKLSSDGMLQSDKRGRKETPNKLAPDRYNFLLNHILSFPAVESHYCRKNSQYRYLDSKLNLSIMYREYKKLCQENEQTPAGIETYRRIFHTYKLRFHVPKKDLCKKCIAQSELKNVQNEQTQSSQSEIDFAQHIKRKDDAFTHRDKDKASAKNDKSVLAFNFDLESVLVTPKGAAGPFFYVRKLAVYNLTFYNLGNQEVDCYTWDETEGKRGSAEIATSVYKYINSQPPGITHVKLMSDNCGGQQKNFNFCCMLLHLIENHPTIEVIDHAFFETGHSHMECDSVHSKIEQKSKNIPVFTPDGWIQIMRLARTNPVPFNVVTLVHDDFLDFNPNQVQFSEEIPKKPKAIRSKIKKKPTTEKTNHDNIEQTNEEDKKGHTDEVRTKKEKILFTDAVWIQFRKESPDSIFIKTDYQDEFFTELKLKGKKGKGKEMPKAIYSKRLPISVAKKTDLMKLCHELLIPKAYHKFYESLPTSEIVVDRLPEPDAREE